jgi:hypothetical protein
MFSEPHIGHNKTIVEKMLADYPIEIESLPSFDEFIETCLYGVISIKIWDEKLTTNESTSFGPIKYLQEIISNLNQVIILSALGFKVPTYVLLRRSLENIFAFLYYKDHPIEYYHRDVNLKRSLNRDHLIKYLKEYPFEIENEQLNLSKINGLMNKIINIEKDTYEELSYYVHATSSQHLELQCYLDELKPNDDFLKEITPHIENINTIVNTFNILFFHKVYFDLKEEEKEVIRFAISNNGHIKKQIQKIYGYV